MTIRYTWLIVMFLYSFLWLLDTGKANEIIENLTEMGRFVASKISVLKSKIKPPDTTNSAKSSVCKPIKVNLSVSTKRVLQNFLNSPNEKLINQKSSYTQKASYYIDVDINAGLCKPKYSKKYCGFWKTPADILCPQVNKILQTPTGEPNSNLCLLTIEEAKKQGWDCNKMP